MSRLPTLTPRQVVAALKRAGYEEHHQRGSHLVLRHQDTRLRLVVPMHARDLPRGTMKSILRDAHLTEDEFAALL